MNNLEKAKELKRRFGLWDGKREGFNIKDEVKELLKETRKERIKSDNFKGTSKERDDIFEIIKICKEILE